MKGLYLSCILFTFLFSSCYTAYSKLKNKQKSAVIQYISPFELSKALNNETALFYINSQDVKEIQNTLKDKDDRLFIIFFNFWCPSFKENRERIVNLVESNANVTPLFITSDDFRLYDYYQEEHQKILNSDIFMIDVLKYGNGKRNPHKRQEPFVEKVCPDCVEKTGFPNLIVFDKNKNLMFNSTGSDSLDFIQLQSVLMPN